MKIETHWTEKNLFLKDLNPGDVFTFVGEESAPCHLWAKTNLAYCFNLGSGVLSGYPDHSKVSRVDGHFLEIK